MRQYWKWLLALMALLLVCALIVGCGGTEGDQTSDSDSESSVPEDTDETRHQHTTTGDPIEVVPSTCSTRGYKQYRCDECNARYVEELPIGRHDYMTQYDATLGYEVVKCNGCNDWRMEVDGAGEYTFAAVCSGEISFAFEVLGGNAELDFVIDGNVVKSDSYEAGAHIVTVAEDLAKGSHTFGFVLKNGGTALDLTAVEADGELYRANAIILEMTKASAGRSYSDFYVYVQTTDPSGDYYVRYRFYYVYSTVTTNATNSATNIDMFRIAAAELVQVREITDTAVSYTSLYKLLSSGEISLAIKEYVYDPAQGKNGVADFCGGFHGDEHIVTVDGEKQAFLKADGVSYTPGAESRIVKCSALVFDQTTLLDRWATVAGSAGQFAKHTQNFEITPLGMTIDRKVEWLVDDFVIDSAYPMMFTLHRVDGDKAVCEIVSTYDADGKLLGSETLALHNTDKQTSVLPNAALRRVEFSSATSGIFSTASFTLGKYNDGVLGTSYIAYRTDNGGSDNKLYVPMKGANTVQAEAASGTVTKSSASQGDVWEINCFYHIDYIHSEN